MTDVKRFTKFLKDNGYRTSWDARLSYDDDFVKYQDQGGWFKLEEALNGSLLFEAHSECTGWDEETEENVDEDIKETFNTYEKFLSYFKGLYSCC